MTAITTSYQRTEWHRKVEAGVKAAIAKALAEHRKAGRSIVITCDGQIVTLSPDEIPVVESTQNTTD